MVITRPAVLRFCNLFVFLLVVVTSGLGFRFPFGAQAMASGEVSGLEDNITDIIAWGVMYGTMLLFVVYQLLPRTYRYEYITHGITPYFLVQSMAYSIGGLLHIYLVKTRPYMEMVTLVVISICQILSYSTVSAIVTRNQVEEEGSDDHLYYNYIFGRAWLSIHMAWITCSLFGNLTIAISKLSSFSHVPAAFAICGLGILALIFVGKEDDVLFGAVVVWEFMWLAIATYDGDSQEKWSFFTTTIIIGSLVGLATVVTLVRNIMFLIARAKSRQTVPLRNA